MLSTSHHGVQIDYLVAGTGSPVTVFAHGLSASIAETRPLASGVAGTRVFFHFRGHGASATPADGWDYAGLAADLRAVADHCQATRALGVSMGAGALLRVLTETPSRFERVVFFLPAALDRPRDDVNRDRLIAMADASDAGDAVALAELLLADQPEAIRDRPAVARWVRERSRALVGTPVSRAVRSLPFLAPIDDRAALADVRVPALVVGQEGDRAHPAWVARELAAALPDGRCEIFADANAVWQARARLRRLIAGFLAG